MILLLDGPAAPFKLLNVSTVTPIEVKAGGSSLDERQAITLQPEGKIYVYLAPDDTTPLASEVSDVGFMHGKNAIRTYEAGPKQKVWILADSGTFDVRGAERA